jgi:hypothetical protein
MFEEIGTLFQANKRVNGDYEREQNSREQLARLGYRMFRQQVRAATAGEPNPPQQYKLMSDNLLSLSDIEKWLKTRQRN